jgi:hypothetical protein
MRLSLTTVCKRKNPEKEEALMFGQHFSRTVFTPRYQLIQSTRLDRSSICVIIVTNAGEFISKAKITQLSHAFLNANFKTSNLFGFTK